MLHDILLFWELLSPPPILDNVKPKSVEFEETLTRIRETGYVNMDEHLYRDRPFGQWPDDEKEIRATFFSRGFSTVLLLSPKTYYIWSIGEGGRKFSPWSAGYYHEVDDTEGIGVRRRAPFLAFSDYRDAIFLSMVGR